MKIVLNQDVKNLGKAGDIKDVADGYARNYLIPQNLAQPATAAVVKQAEAKKQAATRREEKQQAEFRTLADRIEKLNMKISARVGTEDRLYGAITNQELAERMTKELGVEIDRRKIILEDPIRHTGTFSVPVHLASGVHPKLNVTVEAANAPAAAQGAQAPAAEAESSNNEG